MFKKPDPTLDFILKAPAGIYYLHRLGLADIIPHELLCQSGDHGYY